MKKRKKPQKSIDVMWKTGETINRAERERNVDKKVLVQQTSTHKT